MGEAVEVAQGLPDTEVDWDREVLTDGDTEVVPVEASEGVAPAVKVKPIEALTVVEGEGG